MTRLILPLLLAIAAGCAKPAAVRSPWTAPPPGSFISAAAAPLSDADVAVSARAADFILVGESHTNPCDHAVKIRLIEAMAAAGIRFAIGLEMLPVTAQPVLDRFNARALTAADLGEETGWEKLWGYPYAQYRPVFELAERYGLPVAALNTPRPLLTKFRDSGDADLTPEERELLPKRVIPASQPQRDALQEQVGLHQTMRSVKGSAPQKGKQPGAAPDMGGMAEKFFLVQAIWDSMMAEQALAWKARLAMPMVILAGNGHVEHGWGIEYRLRTLDPSVSCLAVAPVRDDEDFAEQAAPGKRAFPGEAVFFYCAAQHKSRLGMNILFGKDAMTVESVDPGSRAAKAGLLAGDTLLEAGGRPLTEATDLHFAAMAASREKKPLSLKILRAGQPLTLDLPLD